MKLTAYGIQMRDTEPLPSFEGTGGATKHALACAYDSGIEVVLTGTRYHSGARFTQKAHSVLGAWMTMKAVGGLNNAWHVLPDGTRKKLITR